MAQKKGRPKNYSIDEIKLIIDQYVRYTEGRSIISASQVAKFATEELDKDKFYYYVINRKKQTKQYLEEKNERIKNGSITEKGTPVSVFRTIDIEAFLNKTPQQLGTALQNLNMMLEDMSDKHAKVIQENMQLSRQCASSKAEVVSYKKELDESINKSRVKEKELTEVIKQLKSEIKGQEEIGRMLWDKEAETLLKKQNIFEDDGTEIDDTKIITEPTYDLINIANNADIMKKKDESKVTEMRKGFLQGLEDL